MAIKNIYDTEISAVSFTWNGNTIATQAWVNANVSTPTLDAVTTSGSVTTNNLSVGSLNVTGGTIVSGVDTRTNVGIAIAKGDYLTSNDGSYIRNLIGLNSSSNIEIGQSGTSLISNIQLKPGSNGNIQFYASGSEDVRINSSGNVGIGTTSPVYKLDVTGDIRTSGAFRGVNIALSGYIDLTGDLNHRSNIRVLNKLGTNWITWATRDTSGADSKVVLSNVKGDISQFTNDSGYLTSVPSHQHTDADINSWHNRQTVNIDTYNPDSNWSTSIATSTSHGTQPSNYTNIHNLGGDGVDFQTQIATYYGNNNRMWVRSRYDGTNAWVGWNEVWTSGSFANNSANWDTAYSWGDHASAGYVTSSGNTVIGTDSDINTSGSTIIDNIYVTDGVITSMGTRTLTPADIGAGYYDHIRSLGTQAFTNGSNPNITTAQVMSEIESDGGFDSYTSVFKTSWSYAGNYNLTDAGNFTETAGSSWITWTDNSSDSTRGNITALAIAPTTGGSAGGVFIYNDQGGSYSPGWREVWTSSNFANNSSNWNTAYGWGDHAAAGYLTSYSETDTLATVVARGAFFGTTNQGYVASGGTYGTELRKIKRITLTTGSSNWNSDNHAILSKGLTGADDDSISINSYNGIHLRLDSNNNDVNSNTNFTIHNNTTTNTNELFRVTGDGNVGIGTTSPGYTLDVNGSMHSTNITIADAIYHEGDTNTVVGFGTDTINLSTGGGVRATINNSGTKFNNDVVVVGGATLSLGERGEPDDLGRTVLLEGAANAGSGEGAGRIFFSEHNSTTAGADSYGLSLYYEGDPNIALPSGFQPNTGNGTWSLRRHNNSVNGAAIMSGSRTNSDVQFGGSITIGSGVTLSESTDRADLLSVTSSTSGWGGLQITNTAGDGIWSFMVDGAAAGIYDDQNGEWAVYCVENSYVQLRHNGTGKLTTSSSGVDVAGRIYLSANDSHIEFNTSASSGHPKIQMGADADFSFLNTAGSTNLHIENGGKVGIGTTSPAEKLDIAGNVQVGISSGYNRVGFIRNGGSGVGAIGWHSDGNFYIGGHPEHGPSAGNVVRVYGFGSDIRLGDSLNGDVLNIQRSSGNVGIGTTSPSRKLHVSTGNGDIAAKFENTSSNGTVLHLQTTGDNKSMYFQTDHIYVSSGAMHFGNDTGDLYLRPSTSGGVGIGTTSISNAKLKVAGGGVDIESSTDSLRLRFYEGTTFRSGVQHVLNTGEMISGSAVGDLAVRANAGNMLFATGGSAERMRIASNGNVGIGTTSPSRQLHVSGSTFGAVLISGVASDAFSEYDDGTNVWKAGIDYSQSAYRITHTNFNGAGISLDSSGNLTADGDITAFSDARLKENVKTLPNALESVKAMRGVTYNKIGEEKQSIGVIAQEVQAVLPQLVSEHKDEMLSVAYGNITAVLIEAVKELTAKVESLEEQLKNK